jgi:hypothetical protein
MPASAGLVWQRRPAKNRRSSQYGFQGVHTVPNAVFSYGTRMAKVAERNIGSADGRQARKLHNLTRHGGNGGSECGEKQTHFSSLIHSVSMCCTAARIHRRE